MSLALSMLGRSRQPLCDTKIAHFSKLRNNQALSEYIDKQRLEQDRWQQTLDAMEPAAQGKVVDASLENTLPVIPRIPIRSLSFGYGMGSKMRDSDLTRYCT